MKVQKLFLNAYILGRRVSIRRGAVSFAVRAKRCDTSRSTTPITRAQQGSKRANLASPSAEHPWPAHLIPSLSAPSLLVKRVAWWEAGTLGPPNHPPFPSDNALMLLASSCTQGCLVSSQSMMVWQHQQDPVQQQQKINRIHSFPDWYTVGIQFQWSDYFPCFKSNRHQNIGYSNHQQFRQQQKQQNLYITFYWLVRDITQENHAC